MACIRKLGDRMASAFGTSAIDVCDNIIKVLLDVTTTYHYAMIGVGFLNDAIREQKRRQKSIDRMAWQAEAAQRYAKGRHFK